MLKSKSFYFTFLRSLLQEVKLCYPEYSFEFDEKCLDELEASDFSLLDHVRSLSSIGKAIDNALTSNEPYVIPEIPVTGYLDACGEPFLCGVLFHEVFTSHRREGLCHSRYFINHQGRIYRRDGVNPEDPAPTDLKTVESVASSVFFLRQLYLSFSKVDDLDCIARESDEYDSFVDRISAVPTITLSSSIASKARKLISTVLEPNGELHPLLVEWINNPHGLHGPGAVAGKEKGRQKWLFHLIPGQKPDIFDAQTSTLRDFVTVDPVSRATLVPKDFRKHRIICVEPKEFMFEQQGLWNTIRKIVALEPLTAGSICFERQDLSRRRSRNFQSYSTIDLSDASDLISKQLGRILLSKRVYRLLCASRSRFVLVRGARIKSNALFTMGNALCFPLETLIFWALSLAALLERDECPLACASEKARHVRVFGDDIIVPRRAFDDVLDALCRAGAKPNLSKCCHRSLAREACGAWWYGGVDCGVSRMSKTSLHGFKDWTSGLDQARNLNSLGLSRLSRVILDQINLISPVPYGYFGLPGSKDEVNRAFLRYNRSLQRWEFRMPSGNGAPSPRTLPGEAGLYAYFTGSATSGIVTVREQPKLRWVSLER